MYLDRVGCTDCPCHLEEIWLFVTGLSHPNGNAEKAHLHLVEIFGICRGACNELRQSRAMMSLDFNINLCTCDIYIAMQ